MNRCLAALGLASVLLLRSVPVRADYVYSPDYWPYAGVWVYLESSDPSDLDTWQAWVYCGYGCVEFQDASVSGPASVWLHDTVPHNNYRVQPNAYIFAQWGYVIYNGDGTTYQWWTNDATVLHAIWDCNDARSDINQEYVDWGVYADSSDHYMPLCGYGGTGFQSGGGYGPFPFSVLNTGNYSWAVIRYDYLYGFLWNVQNGAGYNITIGSAYRNPVRNGSVGGDYLSRHQWGDAADFKPWFSPAGCVDTGNWEWLREVASSQGATYIEPYSLDCTHVHADLRGW